VSELTSRVIATDRDGPLAYGALGAYFQLERVTAEDEDRFTAVHDKLWSWLGPHLKWTWTTSYDEHRAARREDLEEVECFAADLKVAGHDPSDPQSAVFLANTSKLVRMDTGVQLKGGESSIDPSPFMYDFWAEIPEVDASGVLAPYAVLSFSVPESWPADDFGRRFLEIASMLRIRWATAGFRYATWDTRHLTSVHRAIRIDARRRVGYDVGYFHQMMELLHHRLRTVNWLTVLGGDLGQRALPLLGSLREVELLQQTPLVVLRAGSVPRGGDINRLDVPSSYVELDKALRPLILDDAEEAVFLGEWQPALVQQWLRRFTRRTS
jgi:hypothetical protein